MGERSEPFDRRGVNLERNCDRKVAGYTAVQSQVEEASAGRRRYARYLIITYYSTIVSYKYTYDLWL